MKVLKERFSGKSTRGCVVAKLNVLRNIMIQPTGKAVGDRALKKDPRDDR